MLRHVRFTPNSGHQAGGLRCPLSAIGDMSPHKNSDYSVTSSACASIVGGTARPSALPVFKLMIRSNFVGCSTGKSASQILEGPPFSGPQVIAQIVRRSELVFLFLLIAPVLTSITPVRASNAHGRGWITNAGLGIRCGDDRHWHSKAQRSRSAKKGKTPSARNHFGLELFTHHNSLLDYKISYSQDHSA